MKVEVKELIDRRLRYERDSLEALRTNDAAGLAELRTTFEEEFNAIRDGLLGSVERDHLAAHEEFLGKQNTTEEHTALQNVMAMGAHRYDVEREVAIEDRITSMLIRRHAA